MRKRFRASALTSRYNRAQYPPCIHAPFISTYRRYTSGRLRALLSVVNLLFPRCRQGGHKLLPNEESEFSWRSSDCYGNNLRVGVEISRSASFSNMFLVRKVVCLARRHFSVSAHQTSAPLVSLASTKARHPSLAKRD